MQTGSCSDIGEAVFIQSLLSVYPIFIKRSSTLGSKSGCHKSVHLCADLSGHPNAQAEAGTCPWLSWRAEISMYKQSDKKSEIPPSGIAWPADCSFLCDGLPSEDFELRTEQQWKQCRLIIVKSSG